MWSIPPARPHRFYSGATPHPAKGAPPLLTPWIQQPYVDGCELASSFLGEGDTERSVCVTLVTPADAGVQEGEGMDILNIGL